MPRLAIVLASTFALLVATAPLGAQEQPVELPTRELKRPAVAHALAVIPSAGHFYAGETGRGLAVIGAITGLFAAGTVAVASDCLSGAWSGSGSDDCGETPATVFGLAIYGVWGWSIYDAGRAARRTNARHSAQVASRPSLILAPTRAPRSPTEDGTALKVGVRMKTP